MINNFRNLYFHHSAFSFFHLTSFFLSLCWLNLDGPTSRKASVQRYREKRKDRYLKTLIGSKWQHYKFTNSKFPFLYVSHTPVRWRFKNKRKIAMPSSSSLDIYLNRWVGDQFANEQLNPSDDCSTLQSRPSPGCGVVENLANVSNLPVDPNDKGNRLISLHALFRGSSIINYVLSWYVKWEKFKKIHLIFANTVMDTCLYNVDKQLALICRSFLASTDSFHSPNPWNMKKRQKKIKWFWCFIYMSSSHDCTRTGPLVLVWTISAKFATWLANLRCEMIWSLYALGDWNDTAYHPILHFCDVK